jgi:hypothetical protein
MRLTNDLPAVGPFRVRARSAWQFEPNYNRGEGGAV